MKHVIYKGNGKNGPELNIVVPL